MIQLCHASPITLANGMTKMDTSYWASHSPLDYAWDDDVLSGRRRAVCVCDGIGVDSTAMHELIARDGIVVDGIRVYRPDLITFADTGSERGYTYMYVPHRRRRLEQLGFPPLVVCRRVPPRAGYLSLYENCWENATLPSLAFKRGGKPLKSCSVEWKRKPQEAW
jgi:hypothetical protein